MPLLGRPLTLGSPVMWGDLVSVTAPRPLFSWLQLVYFICLNCMPVHIKIIPRNYFHHFPLVFSEGKNFKSHKTHAYKIKESRRSISAKLKQQQKEEMTAEVKWLKLAVVLWDTIAPSALCWRKSGPPNEKGDGTVWEQWLPVCWKREWSLYSYVYV